MASSLFPKMTIGILKISVSASSDKYKMHFLDLLHLKFIDKNYLR